MVVNPFDGNAPFFRLIEEAPFARIRNLGDDGRSTVHNIHYLAEAEFVLKHYGGAKMPVHFSSM
jgi:hypothetical protein